MNFLTVAWYEFLKNVRDIKMLAFITVFPIVVSYLIGAAVTGYFEPYDGKPVAAAVVNLDRGAVGQAFGRFLEAGDVRKRLEATAYASLAEGRAALDSGVCAVLIRLPEDLSESVLKGNGGSIELEGERDIEFAGAIVSAFASSLNASIAAPAQGGGPLTAERAGVATRVSRTKGGAFPNLTDYYAVLVLLQAFVIGGIFGVYITARNYGSDIHIRTHALPVAPWTLLFGRIAGSVAYLMMTSVATILFTRYAYGVNWSGNLPVMAGTLAAFSFIVVSLGAVCGRIFKRTSTSVMVIFALMFFCGTVSGSVSPKSGAVALGFLTPNYYAKQLLFGTIYGYPDAVTQHSALMLAAFAAAACLAVAALTRRGGYDNI